MKIHLYFAIALCLLFKSTRAYASRNIKSTLASQIISRDKASYKSKEDGPLKMTIISSDNSKYSPKGLSNTWPCGDELDKRILGLALPAMLNLAILPLVGAADTFWVGRMGDAQALAGQGAANQVFSSV